MRQRLRIVMLYIELTQKYWVLIFGKWDGEPDQREKAVKWCRDIADELKQYQLGGYQAIGALHDSDGAVQAIFGNKQSRLQDLKRKYDVDNLLCYNQNIKI
jgi:Berberine and berberine like